MDSYDEFARRARIMTQVHAIRVSPVDSEGSKKVSADDSSSTPAVREEDRPNGQKRKAKDAKKKAMKRL